MKKMFCHTILSCLMAAVLLTSCVHKELCYDHPHTCELDVVFDWSKAADADPETMSLYLFPQDGGKSERYEFTDRRGGRIRVLPGEYEAICLNSDTREIVLEDRDLYDSFRLTTADGELHSSALLAGVMMGKPPRAKGTEDERVARSPDKVWTGHLENIIIDETTGSITMTPEKSYIRFSIEVYNVENLEHTYIVSGALTTLSESLLPGRNVLSEENVTLPFSAGFSVAERSIKGGLLAFGHCPGQELQHFLVLYVTMNDGTNLSYRYDVTDQIHDSPDPENILIILDGLTLPKPEGGGDGPSGGLDAVVDEWTSIDIGLNM